MSLTHSQPGWGESIRGSTGVRAVPQGVHVRAIQGDPFADLISSADGPVTGDDNVDLIGHVLECPQPDEVLADRVVGAGEGVEHRDEEIGHHVAGDENPAVLDQQRRMARGMRRVLDDPDFRAVPGNPRGPGR